MSNLPAVRGTNGELVTYSLPDVIQIAGMMVTSGLVPDSVKTPAAAAVIILKGLELGLMPFQSLEDVYVVNGKASLSTKLMVSLWLKRGHNYTVLERTTEKVRIRFELKTGVAHELTMTMAEAQLARWDCNWDKETKQWKPKPTWKGMPAMMLTYRCLSTGIRLYDPSVLQGTRTKDEASDTIDPDHDDTALGEHTGEVVDGVVTELDPQDPTGQAPTDQAPGVQGIQESGTSRAQVKKHTVGPLLRPFPPSVVIQKLRLANPPEGTQAPVADAKLQGLVAGAIEDLFETDTQEIKTGKRRGILLSAYGTDTTKTLTKAQCTALLGWSREKIEEEGQVMYVPSGYAVKEAAAILAERDADAGQMDLGFEQEGEPSA